MGRLEIKFGSVSSKYATFNAVAVTHICTLARRVLIILQTEVVEIKN